MKEQVLAVQRMQDYIEQNNAKEISLSDLSKASLFSPWYSYRLFREYIGITPADYMGAVPEGFDTIMLPETEYLVFQGQTFNEEDYCEAIHAVQHAMDGYDPTAIGYEWDDGNPRIQLEPRGERGYIEMRAVKRASK